jgi:hypothetical protein
MSYPVSSICHVEFIPPASLSATSIRYTHNRESMRHFADGRLSNVD